jgi:hypothetical protein
VKLLANLLFGAALIAALVSLGAHEAHATAAGVCLAIGLVTRDHSRTWW